MPTLLSIAEAARKMRVSKRSVQRLIAAGKLPKTQYVPGSLVFIPDEAVDGFIRESTTTASDNAAA